MASSSKNSDVDDSSFLDANKSSIDKEPTDKTCTMDQEDWKEKINVGIDEDSTLSSGVSNENLLKAEANNSHSSRGQPLDSTAFITRSRKGQGRKLSQQEANSNSDRTKMRLKCKKINTRANQRLGSKDAESSGDLNNSSSWLDERPVLLSRSASPGRPAMLVNAKNGQEWPSANKESSAWVKEEEREKAEGLSASLPSSCQHDHVVGRGRKQSSSNKSSILALELSSSASAPASPSARTAIRARGSRSPAMITCTKPTSMATDRPIDNSLHPSRLGSTHSARSLLASVKSETSLVSNMDTCTLDTTTSASNSDRKTKRASDEQTIMSWHKRAKFDHNHKEDQQKKQDNSTTICASTFIPMDESKGDTEKQEAGTWVRTVGTTTESDCLGPCEPGTSVTLEGIVWNETKGGMLVVNVTWRGKTYVGTLLDCTKYDWAPPQFCDSPPNNDSDPMSNSNPWSNFGNSSRASAKCGSSGNGRGRKGHNANRAAEARRQQQQAQNANNSNSNGSSESNSDHASQETRSKKPIVSDTVLEPDAPIMYQCPFGSCEKKFSAVVGLRYHQTANHRNITCKTAEKHLHANSANGKSPDDKNTPTSGGAKDGKPNLDMLKAPQGKSVEQPQNSQQTGSPVYSDISEDDSVAAPQLQPVLDETVPVALSHASTHPIVAEKPMAIVEPQCATASSMSGRNSVIDSRPSVSMPKSNRNEKTKDGPSGLKQMPESACPPLLPTLDMARQKKSTTLEPKLGESSNSMAFAMPTAPTPVNLGPSPSPMPVGPTAIPQNMRPQSGPAMNMVHQINPAFMFNPYNHPNAAMFPGGQLVQQGMFPPGLNLDSPAAQAALMAAGQQYGFPMGLHNHPTSHHGPVGLFGGPPIVSMAPIFSCAPQSGLGLPHNVGQFSTAQNSAAIAANNRLQQAHKIHELAEHAKRASAAAADTSVIVDALRRTQAQTLSSSPSIVTGQGRRQQITPAPQLDADAGQKLSRSMTPAKSVPSSTTSVPTSVITSPTVSDHYGQQKNAGTTAESSRQQQSGMPKISSPTSRAGILSISPPVQRHLHTHHHTHTTYPALLASGMDPYSAMVASQQAAATVVGGYTPFGSSSKSS